MDNAQKAIMIGVGLFITIIIISAVLLITNMGSSTINKSTTELGAISDSTQNQIIKDYDGKIISSTETLELIKKYYTGKDGVSIIFTNNTTNAYPYNKLSDKARVGAKYINYYGGLVYVNGNHTLNGQAKQVYFFASDHVYTFSSDYVKTSLSAFSDSTNQFYIAPGAKYKTCVIYTDSKYVTAAGISIQKAS